MNRTSQTISALLLTMGITVTAFAAELPAYYPDSFDKTGTINDLTTDPNRKVIVISDGRYPLSPGVVVHSPLVRNGGATLLKIGQKVGYTVTGAGPTTAGAISEMWVFPAGYVPNKK